MSPQRSSSYHTLSSLSPLSEFSGSTPEYSDVSDVENNIAKAITVASVDVEEGVCVSPDSKTDDRDILQKLVDLILVLIIRNGSYKTNG